MPALPAILSLLIFLPAAAEAADAVRIGISAPLSGPYESLGAQIVSGARAAQSVADAGVELVIADDKCTRDGGRAAARFLSESKVSAIIGYLCTGPLIAAMPEAASGKVPLISLGARQSNLVNQANGAGAMLFRLSPNNDSEPEAIAALLLPQWRGKKFAIVDDGTIHARELAESFRVAAEGQGLRPAFVDTFRPALENQTVVISRLKTAGVTHVFAGGDRDDVAIIARDAAAAGFALTIAGGESLMSAPGEVPMKDGVMMVAAWESKAVSQIGGNGAAAEGYHLPARAAVEIILGSAAARDAKSLAQAIGAVPHPTVLGEIRFAASGELADNPYRLKISKDGVFQDYQ